MSTATTSSSIPPLLTTSLSLIQTLTAFLTISIHTILYHRGLYPASTFLLTRAYNFPVQQSRHPLVCKWINDTIAALTPLLLRSAVRRVIVVIYSANLAIMERFVFDIERFPVVGEKEAYVEFGTREGSEGREGNPGLMKGIPKVDIDEQLRATIRKLQYSCERLDPLPEGCTYTVAVELRDEAEPPIGNPQPWVPSEPSLQLEKGKGVEGTEAEPEVGTGTIGSDLGGVRTVPVRLVEAGEFVLETWIEEGRAKVYGDDGD